MFRPELDQGKKSSGHQIGVLQDKVKNVAQHYSEKDTKQDNRMDIQPCCAKKQKPSANANGTIQVSGYLPKRSVDIDTHTHPHRGDRSMIFQLI